MLCRARHPLLTALLILAMAVLAARRSPLPGPSRLVGGTYCAIATPTGFRVVSPDEVSADEVVRALVDAPGDVGVFELVPGEQPRDFFLWRDPVRPVGIRLETVVNPGWSAERLEAARRAVIEHSAPRVAARDPALAERLRRSPDGEWKWHWPSAAWNAGVWTLLALTAWSLGWVPQAWARFRATRRKKRLALGLCPVCRYPVPEGAERCPECGQEYVSGRAGVGR